eukprot:scaffold154238_cov33-Prasinocladus_malaysianus.AAC.1
MTSKGQDHLYMLLQLLIKQLVDERIKSCGHMSLLRHCCNWVPEGVETSLLHHLGHSDIASKAR